MEYRVIISDAQRLVTEPHELDTAKRLADYFKCDVLFVPARNAYKVKTPDIEMNGKLWELKSPQGSSRKNTIRYQLKRGRSQSRNIVIDTARTNLSDEYITRQLINRIKDKHERVDKLVIVDKNRQVHVLK